MLQADRALRVDVRQLAASSGTPSCRLLDVFDSRRRSPCVAAVRVCRPTPLVLLLPDDGNGQRRGGNQRHGARNRHVLRCAQHLRRGRGARLPQCSTPARCCASCWTPLTACTALRRGSTGGRAPARQVAPWPANRRAWSTGRPLSVPHPEHPVVRILAAALIGTPFLLGPELLGVSGPGRPGSGKGTAYEERRRVLRAHQGAYPPLPGALGGYLAVAPRASQRFRSVAVTITDGGIRCRPHPPAWNPL